MDNMTKVQRSRTMSRIRSKETKPEQQLRSFLHNAGYRFRKNVKGMPGTPDIVLPKHQTVIFVQGCFWHQHQNCLRAVMPKTNKEYWEDKLEKNVKRDNENVEKLPVAGWHVIVAWECEINEDIEAVFSRIKAGLNQ